MRRNLFKPVIPKNGGMKEKGKQQKVVLLVVVIFLLAVGAFAAKDSIRKVLMIELPFDLLHVKGHVRELANKPEIREQNPDVLFITGPDFSMPEAQQSTEAELLLREQYQQGTIEEQTCQQQTQFKDKCYLLLARQDNNPHYCLFVGDVQKRDSCLIRHILAKDRFDQQDIETCSEISNTYIQQSCTSLNVAHAKE